MPEIIEFIQRNISAFDLTVFLIVIYSMAQCAAKGFMMSLLSFSKWLLALIITIILVPKLNPLIEDYIESQFVTDIGLGIFIYIVSLFIIINIRKAINKPVKYTGLGSVVKSFGLILFLNSSANLAIFLYFFFIFFVNSSFFIFITNFKT